MQQTKVISPVLPGTPDDLFIACASFEDRCVGSAKLFKNYAARTCCLVNFTSRGPNPIGERKRRKNSTDMATMFAESRLEVKWLKVDPYNPLDLRLQIDAQLARKNIQLDTATISVDISCFTRIQLLYLLKHLTSRPLGTLRLLYTTPGYYGSLDRKQSAIGYDRLLTAPFDRGPSPERPDANITMLILLGHEGARILHAWTEIDPSATVLIESETEGDPEVARVTDRENASLLSRANDENPEFTRYSCSAIDIDRGIELFRGIAARFGAPSHTTFAFVPMGPKPLVAAFVLANSGSGENVDIAYPIPHKYNPDYSMGIGHTFTFTWKNSSSKGHSLVQPAEIDLD
jgi:hypothetical protein